MVYILVLILLIAMDQLTKYYILDNFELYQSIPIFDKYLHLTYIKNFGAAFGILQNFQLLFIIITSLIIIFMGYYFIISNKESIFLKTTLIIIISGGIGNLIDRIRFGFVIDFIEVKLMNIVPFLKSDFPVFNVADTLIVIGSIMLSYYILFKYDKEVKNVEK